MKEINILPLIGTAKVWLALSCWAVCLPMLLAPVALPPVVMTFALILFLAFLGLATLRLKKQSFIICGALLGIGWLVLPELPDWPHLKKAGSFVLIFACLMPTLTLVRASAMTMPSVARVQERLASLAPAHSAAGVQLTSQMLGAVMNVGAFALVSVALPRDADEQTRLVAAEASLRGMNAAILWSPFFISFAVASIYLPAGFASGAIALGVMNALLFFVVTSALAAPAGARFAILRSLQPLAPIASRLFFAIICVILMSLATGFTALYAVSATMPLLCLLQMLRRPDTIKAILSNFFELQKSSGDELVIISLSMFIASLVSQTDDISAMLTSLFGAIPDIKLMLFTLPVIVWTGSVVGVHPVISSVPLLTFFAPDLTVYDAMFIAQAHMIGWSTGTMMSFSSLSLVIVAEQFRLRATQLAFGPNLIAAGTFAAGGGLLLGFLHQLLAEIAG